MSEIKYTVEDLDRMTPEERRRSFDECVVTDVTQLPPDLQRHLDEAEAWARQYTAAPR